MPIGLQKLFIKEYPPLFVEEFLLAVGKKYTNGSLVIQVLCQKILEFVW